MLAWKRGLVFRQINYLRTQAALYLLAPLAYGRSTADLQQVGSVREKRDLEVLVRTRQGVRSRGLEVRAKGDDIATRAIRRERDTEDVASTGNRGRIDGAGRAAGAGDTAGVAIGCGEREADGPTEADRAVRLVERGALRDRGATGQRGGRVGITGRNHGCRDLA